MHGWQSEPTDYFPCRFTIYLILYPCICPSVNLSQSLSSSLFLFLSLSLYLSICCLSSYLSLWPSLVSVSSSISISISISFCIYPSIYLPIYLSIRKEAIMRSGRVYNRAILGGFLSFWRWQQQKRSNFVRLPSNMKSWEQSWRLVANKFLRFVHPTSPKQRCRVIRSAAPALQNHPNHPSKPEDLMLQNATPLRNHLTLPTTQLLLHLSISGKFDF